MSGGPAILFYVLLLILPTAALVARRTPMRTVVRFGLIWAAIFLIGGVVLTTVM